MTPVIENHKTRFSLASLLFAKPKQLIRVLSARGTGKVNIFLLLLGQTYLASNAPVQLVFTSSAEYVAYISDRYLYRG